MRFARRKAAAVGLALLGAQGHAQDLRISATGTNIKRADTETAAPIETITREDILASGLQTISEVLRQITANNNGSISPSFTNGLSQSGSAISLRGPGPNNALVLLNGRRCANSGLADDMAGSPSGAVRPVSASDPSGPAGPFIPLHGGHSFRLLRSGA